jgi:proteasome beta subunit
VPTNEHGRSPDAGHGHPTHTTGTTTVALAAADGVVVAADRRVSLGGRFVASKDAEKVAQVHPRGVVATAGSASGAQTFADRLRAEVDLYEARRGERMSATALTRTASRLVRGLGAVPLLGAVDDDGPRVAEVGHDGAVLVDDYAAQGSGLQLVYGVLEQRYERGLDVDAAAGIAGDAVRAASERDTASGNGLTVARVTADGVTLTVDRDGDTSAGERERTDGPVSAGDPGGDR